MTIIREVELGAFGDPSRDGGKERLVAKVKRTPHYHTTQSRPSFITSPISHHAHSHSQQQQQYKSVMTPLSHFSIMPLHHALTTTTTTTTTSRTHNNYNNNNINNHINNHNTNHNTNHIR
jgi:hypothetical protein